MGESEISADNARASRERLMRVLLIAAIVLGVGLRAKQYFSRYAFWHDEASLVLNIFTKPAAELMGPLESAQAAAPGFLFAQRGAYVLLGRSELAMRLIPFTASIVSMLLFARLVWRLLPRPEAAIVAVLTWACAERLIWHAAEAKQYSVDVLVALTLLSVALRESTDICRRLLACAAIAAVAVWFSHPTVFVFGGIALALWPSQRRDWITWIGGNALVGCSFIALYFLSIRRQQVAVLYDYWAEGFIDWARPWMIPVWLVRQLASLCNYALDLGGAVLLPLAVIGGWMLWKSGRRRTLAILVGPVAMVLIAALLRQYPFSGSRLTLFLTPSVFLLAGFAVAAVFDLVETRRVAVPDRRLRRVMGVGATAYLVGLALWHAGMYTFRPPIHGNMPAVVHYVDARDRDSDLVYTNKLSEFRCYWGERPVRDVSELKDHVPDGRFWIVLSYVAGRRGRTADQPLAGVLPEAVQIDSYEVPGASAILFDGIDGPRAATTRSSAENAGAEIGR